MTTRARNLTVALTPTSPPEVAAVAPRAMPMHRIVTTELRKMFDTRSGSWLLASIAVLALLASAAVILFADPTDLSFDTFLTAIAIPMTLILPIIAILSVTSEWSQRSGLTTFTLVPQRSRIIAGKAIACVGVAVVSVPLVFGIGALGNVVGSAIAGTEPVWDRTPTTLATIVLANVLSLLVGFMFGVLILNSAGALVAYFVYQFVLPTLALVFTGSQRWFRHLQPWIDFDHAQKALFDVTPTTDQWSQLGVTGLIWLGIPLTVGLGFVMRSEVK